MAKGIATFCVHGNKATGWPGKKIAACGFSGFLREGPVWQRIRQPADDTVLVTFAKTKVTKPLRL